MSDDWATPDWLWGCFPNFYDPCPPNSKGLRESDGLSDDWAAIVKSGNWTGLKLNPPHSNPLPWVTRGIRTAQMGVKVIMLLRLDSTTQQHKALIEHGFHPFGAFERIKYGNSNHGGQYANVLWFSP